MSRCHWSVNDDGGQGRGSWKGHRVVMDMVINGCGLKELAEKMGREAAVGYRERGREREGGRGRERERITDLPRSP